MPQASLAVVPRELLGGKHELLFRLRHPRGLGRIESVDDEPSVHLNRLFRIVFVKVDPRSKAAHARLARFVQHGLGPHRDDRVRPGWRRVLAPGKAMRQFPASTTGRQQCHRQEASDQPGADGGPADADVGGWPAGHKFTPHRSRLPRPLPRLAARSIDIPWADSNDKGSAAGRSGESGDGGSMPSPRGSMSG
jgi:hypothetical protein